MTQPLQGLLQQLQRSPDDPEIHYELGRCYLAAQQPDAAEAAFKQALKLVPGHPQILMQLGNVASLRGQEAVATDFFQQSLAQDPAQADVLFNLGNSLRKLGKSQDAIQHYRRALQLAPNDAECHNNLGNALRELGQLDQAVANYTNALRLNPQLTHAKVHWIHQKQHMADWAGLEQAIAEVRQALKQDLQAQIPPFAFLAMPGTTAEEQRLCSDRWAHSHYGHIEALPSLTARPAHTRIKLGYLSSDFRKHPLAYLVTDVIAAHDRSQFEVVLYSQAKDDHSAERAAFVAAADQWVDIAYLTDAEVAARMRAEQIDVMVDLTGYTQHSRSGIAAYRPARLHVNWLGYPGSMGHLHGRPLFDAIITDATLSQVATAEQALCLPCYQPNNATRPHTAAGTRASHGLPEQGLVFCCFNQSFKITPTVFASWMRILQQVPASVLWLLQCNPWATANLRQAATRAGVDADRLIFAERTSIDQHIARLQHADLMLDTAPYNAHTTASDALWQGIPLLTVAGDTFPSRVTASLLTHIGLDECICADWPSLERRAIALACQPEALRQLKQSLRRQSHTLFDPQAFCLRLEQAYQAWLSDSAHR